METLSSWEALRKYAEFNTINTVPTLHFIVSPEVRVGDECIEDSRSYTQYIPMAAEQYAYMRQAREALWALEDSNTAQVTLLPCKSGEGMYYRDYLDRGEEVSATIPALREDTPFQLRIGEHTVLFVQEDYAYTGIVPALISFAREIAKRVDIQTTIVEPNEDYYHDLDIYEWWDETEGNREAFRLAAHAFVAGVGADWDFVAGDLVCRVSTSPTTSEYQYTQFDTPLASKLVEAAKASLPPELQILQMAA